MILDSNNLKNYSPYTNPAYLNILNLSNIMDRAEIKLLKSNLAMKRTMSLFRLYNKLALGCHDTRTGVDIIIRVATEVYHEATDLGERLLYPDDTIRFLDTYAIIAEACEDSETAAYAREKIQLAKEKGPEAFAERPEAFTKSPEEPKKPSKKTKT